MKTKKTNRAKSAKANVKRNATKNVANIEVVKAVESESTVASLPVVTEIESNKVSSKEVLKAAGTIRAAIKEERRGANVTIRLIAERAAAGDAAAVDILCALCDVPRAALFSLNLDKIRTAVNAWYPYYVEDGTRRASVKPSGFWYTDARPNEKIGDASKRVCRGYRATTVKDYLEQLITAAKSRAKGVKPRRVDANTVYDDGKLSTAATGITATDIDEAKTRKAYDSDKVNVWRKFMDAFYI